jgi:fumarate hydratase subunit beta
LGAEAIKKLEVKNFPALVVNDIYGNDLYEARGKALPYQIIN